MIERIHDAAQMIPIDLITVVNGRERGRAKFKQLVASIEKVGLKKPITVARRKAKDGSERYDLACGQGRLEACRTLGYAEIPAMVVDATAEELLLISLVENLARRRHVTLELAREIGAMKDRGYDLAEIARKADLTESYVRGIVKLLRKGEAKLLTAVEKGHIPISIAVTIASSDEEAVRQTLSEAYDKKGLRGKALIRARQIIERILRDRRKQPAGKKGGAASVPAPVSPDKLMEEYEAELARQQALIRRADLCETRLTFIVSAFRSLLRDENFVNVLRAERLESMPQFIADRVGSGSV